uniref:Uncharacterized protein n=1 Tax=Oryza punctata TaxID=4537 RepID=A0A0E0JQ10_ORYPU
MNRQRQQSQRGNATATRGGGSSGKGGGGGGGASPDTGAACSDADAQVAAGHLPAVAATFDEGDGVGGGGYYDDDDIFRSQLLDTSYSVFSPPTLLYDHPHSKV